MQWRRPRAKVRCKAGFGGASEALGRCRRCHLTVSKATDIHYVTFSQICCSFPNTVFILLDPSPCFLVAATIRGLQSLQAPQAPQSQSSCQASFLIIEVVSQLPIASVRVGDFTRTSSFDDSATFPPVCSHGPLMREGVHF